MIPDEGQVLRSQSDLVCAPLNKLRPVHSTRTVTTACNEALHVHEMLVSVILLNTRPLGTSEARVVIVTKSSKSVDSPIADLALR
jgi:hypothetical protein